MQPPASVIRVHGLDLSYFTGKVEGYLRAKGLAYELVEMDTRSFRACARHTGVLQMPQVELPDGRWLTDSPQIIDALEAEHPAPSLTPNDPAVRFAAELLETYGDEHLWRPALYYRWAFPDDARLMSARLARGMLRDLPLPLPLRRQLILARQRSRYLRQDGVTRATAPAIETLFLETLQALEAALQSRPFLLGVRPSRADFGFFGAMFRHFFCDPTPGLILRAQAPRTALWVMRLWAGEGRDGPPVEELPGGLELVLARVAEEFLPYLHANAAAHVAGRREVRWLSGGVAFRTPVNPYRVWRLDRLQASFQALDTPAKAQIAQWLGPPGVELLAQARPRTIPAAAPLRGKLIGREWKAA